MNNLWLGERQLEIGIKIAQRSGRYEKAAASSAADRLENGFDVRRCSANASDAHALRYTMQIDNARRFSHRLTIG